MLVWLERVSGKRFCYFSKRGCRNGARDITNPKDFFSPLLRPENQRKWLQCLKSFYFLCGRYLCSWDRPFQLAPTQTLWGPRLGSCLVKIVIVQIASSLKTSKFLTKPWFLATFDFFTWVTDLSFINYPAKISSVLLVTSINLFFHFFREEGAEFVREVCRVSVTFPETPHLGPISVPFHLD